MRPSKLICLVLAGACLWARGQEDPDPEAGAASAELREDAPVDLEEFVAEGTLIRQVETAFESRSVPIQVIDREQIDIAGFTTAEEYFQNLAINGGGSVPMQNNQTGFTPAASSISLRGLGPDATLVLINGRRVSSYPIGQGGVRSFVDLNSIPASSIERVEILKDSGTARYGADGVAGVVNIITKEGYDGAELTLRYGNDTSGTDSSEFYSSLSFGINDPTGNVTGNLFYLKKNSIFQSDRPFSTVPPFLSSNSIPMNSQISAGAARAALGLAADAPIPGVDVEGEEVSPQDRLILATSGPSNPDGSRLDGAAIDINDGFLDASRYTYRSTWGEHSRYNFNLKAQATPAIERMGAYLSYSRQLSGSEHYRIRGDASFTRAEAHNSLAPTATGNFRNFAGVSIVVPGMTPFPLNRPDSHSILEETMAAEPGPGYTVRPGEDGVLGTEDDLYRLSEVAAGAYNPYNPFNQDLEGTSRIRLEEFGLRTSDSVTDAFFTTWALEARDLEIAGRTWGFDAGMRYSMVDSSTESRFVSKSLINRLMNAADPWFDPGSDVFLGTTTPYNPFGASEADGFYSENNRMIAGNARVTLKNEATSDLFVGFLDAFSGDIYSLPGGDVSLRLGYDWRRENIGQMLDPRSETGDVAGSSIATRADADRYIHGAYANAAIPIVSPDMDSWIHSWDLSLTGRFDHFITSERSSFVPKVSTRILPTRQIALRGSWGLGYREPSLYELYMGLNSGLGTISNPWNPDDLNPEVQIHRRGNPQLDPVDSESFNVGVVYTPDFVKGLSLSLDYWTITRENLVIMNAQDTVDRIFAGDFTYPGEDVRLDAQDNLLLVETVFLNSGYNRTRGIDVGSSISLPTESAGTLSWFFDFTWIIEDLAQSSPTRPLFEYVGYGTGTRFELREPQGVDVQIGTQDGQPLVISNIGTNNDAYLKYRFTTTFAWNYEDLHVSLLGRYTSSFTDIGPKLNLTKVDDRLIWDMQAAYTFSEGDGRWYSNTTLTFGVENLFDQDPPSAFAYYNNSNGYPGFLFEPDGQRYYLSLRKSF